MNVVSMKSDHPALVTEACSSLGKAAYIFSCLSNTVRLAVLLRVIEREWSVNELASELQISQSALSQHLGKLRQGRLVEARRDKQSIFYRCDDDLVRRLLVEARVLRQ